MQKLFDLFFTSSGISPNELALIERTIGSAYWDKLRGNNAAPTRLYDYYIAFSGSDPVTESVLTKIDNIWTDADISSHPLAPPGLDIQQANQELSAPERALIQRTIGRGILDKLRGIQSTLNQIYLDLGGRDGFALQALVHVDNYWPNFKVDPALQALTV
jgi:hypothetical protein